MPAASSTSEVTITRRGPQRSASRPTNGPAAPSRSRETAAAPDSAPRVQPNSASIGLMYTPKTARRPDEAAMQNVSAPSTIQAG